MDQTPTDSHDDEKPVQAQVDHPTYSISTNFHALCDHEENRSPELPDSDMTEIDEGICLTPAPRSISTITSDKSRDVTEKSSKGSSTLPVSLTVAPPSENLQTSRASEQERVVQKDTKCRRKKPLSYGIHIERESKCNNLTDCVAKLLNISIQSEGYHSIMLKHIHTIRKYNEADDRGRFGSVTYFVLYEPAETLIAVKRVPYSENKDKLLSIHAELSVLEATRTDKSDYIVGYFCTLRDFMFNDLYFCMEKMDTSLKKFNETMHSKVKFMPQQLELFVRRCAYNIIMGLAFLESKGFVHRDIKPDNILINRRCAIKLADFGLSGHLTTNEYEFDSAVGTELYMPPDVQQCSTQSDMWALGISLLEIILGKHPITTRPPPLAVLDVNEWKPIVPTAISIGLQEFLLQLLNKKAALRPPSYEHIISTTFIGQMSPDPSEDEIAFVRRVIKTNNQRSSPKNRG
ncbi:unnamed protein product [Adineta ricciae]|uniref:mitogen-activated protein kinase kinase n=1 Tax=Adineta ricciae TaxID=249248 RepID=A0A814QQB1_ADIRI|nr:unnamed protein product [Adineta ricciae]CAF1191846.1 unnamed protein product [Adineta ricciae]